MRIKIAAIVMATLTATGCSGSNDASSDNAPKPRPAKLIEVQASSNQRDLSFPAVIRAAQSADLTFQVAGEIREINVLEGDEVEAGKVIARLDQRDALNRLAQAKAEFDNATTEFERAERLAAQDAISRSVLETRKTQRDVADAAYRTAQKSVGDTVLKTPFSGFISTVSGRQFQNVQAKESIAVLQSEEVEAVINIPGTIIARLPQLEPVGVRVKLDAAPDVEIVASFKEASGEADPNTQTYEVSFSFLPPEDLFILPGMTATVESSFLFSGALDIVAEGISVPLAAVLAEGDELFVWVVELETMTIAKRPIVAQSDAGTYMTVTEGLSGGETIIGAGVSFFHDGMTVRRWVPE
ncbi:MAG: efflux RND transporter periplasmic adaptor subunit [Hyphomonas sp.]|nr:efflux RND transporter periplasmic adaptor subunit [Hyphomonas sp.]